MRRGAASPWHPLASDEDPSDGLTVTFDASAVPTDTCVVRVFIGKGVSQMARPCVVHDTLSYVLL